MYFRVLCTFGKMVIVISEERQRKSVVDKAIVSRAISGESNPTIDNIEKMVKALGLEIKLYKNE